jgi:hypothetical protein
LKRTGAALIAAGIIFNIAIQAVPFNLFQSVPYDILAWARMALQYFASLVIIPGGAFLLWRGKQYAAQASAKLIITDFKSHVLYLRAFRSDASTSKQAFFNTFNSSFLLGLESEEEQLAEVLLPFGELIAIGRPGETLPIPGAARIYTSHKDWKDVVKRQIQAAQLVVIRAAVGENVFWELTQAVKILNPQKLLILMMNMKVRDYESFRTKADSILGVPLPQSTRLVSRRRVSGFIGFAEGWKSSFFALRAPFFRGGSFKRLCKYALIKLWYRMAGFANVRKSPNDAIHVTHRVGTHSTTISLSPLLGVNRKNSTKAIRGRIMNPWLFGLDRPSLQ